MNYKVIFNVLGWVLNVEAVCMLLPLICAVIYPEPEWQAFLTCIALCLLVGALLRLIAIFIFRCNQKLSYGFF